MYHIDNLKKRFVGSGTPETALKTYPKGYNKDGYSLHYPIQIGTLQKLGRMVGDSLAPRDLQLDEYVRTTVRETSIPAYVFDHHKSAFFAWCEAYKEGHVVEGAMLVHIDKHGDEDWSKDVERGLDVNQLGLKQTQEITDKLLNYDFISPALESGLVSKVIWISPWGKSDVTSSQPSTLQHIPYLRIGMDHSLVDWLLNEQFDARTLIIDVDLDYFEPHSDDPVGLQQIRGVESAHEILKSDLDKIKRLAKKAGVVTLATSPGFTDQNEALTLSKRIVE